jgi:hypothetical protein
MLLPNSTNTSILAGADALNAIENNHAGIDMRMEEIDENISTTERREEGECTSIACRSKVFCPFCS